MGSIGRGGFTLIFLSAGTALFAAARELVDGGPSPLLCGFFPKAPFLVAFLDMLRLAFLFVGITGFVTAWHNNFLLVWFLN